MEDEIIIMKKRDLLTVTRSLEVIEEKLDKLILQRQNELPAKWIKTRAVLKYFGISRTVLDRLIAEGKIKAYQVDGRLGGNRYFKVDEILAMENDLFKSY